MNSQIKPAVNIEEWIESLIARPGGFASLCNYEGVSFEPKEAIAFALRALANPDCDGGAEVLAAIHRQRVDKLCGEGAAAPNMGEIAEIIQDVAYSADYFGVPATASILRSNAEILMLGNAHLFESEQVR